jgi:hypothetical protein
MWDENVTLPAPNQPGLDDRSGRGLIMVEALAERWGWDLATTGRGKIVGAGRKLIRLVLSHDRSFSRPRHGWLLSVCGFPVGVAVHRALEDPRGRWDLGLGRPQDRLPARAGNAGS